MRRTTRVAVVASCVALCAAMLMGIGDAPVAAQARSALQPAAILTVFSGEVRVRAAGGVFTHATDGAVLYVGSTVRTGADARAILTLFEGSTLELEPASDTTIEEATRSGSTIGQLALSFGRGWHVVTHLTSADSRYELRTPAATASVRGITFEVVADDLLAGPTMTLTTIESRVATADVATTRLVTPPQTAVPADSAPEPTRSAPSAERVGKVLRVVTSPRVHHLDRDGTVRDRRDRG